MKSGACAMAEKALKLQVKAVHTVSAGNMIETYIDWLKDTLENTEYGKVGIIFDVVDGQPTRAETTCIQSVKLVKKTIRTGT